ncbi:AAA family ATPase [Jeotgalibacillus aurantiacus]|uniref:AAA family ATPase n=1 Tax=Jeotgalibacillus aurantiacus TaxID=2763266 RepID=UPI001D09EDCC|nr:AAA family ATPase [Jeotgalibacillus aurantiacus]
MLRELKIKKFRKFINQTINISPGLTLISGGNGLGKSTLLGIIANGSGTKEFKTLNNKDFHPEFNNYFILSKDEHKDSRKNDDYYEVTLKYHYKAHEVYKRVRTSHPNGPKLKLVPRTVNSEGIQNDKIGEEVFKNTGIKGSERMPIPTYYVSTSRLFPFGESKSLHNHLVKITGRKYISDQFTITKKYIEMYNKVLPRSIDEETDELYETPKPKINYTGIYLKPKSSSILTQSIGQESLSGIINALLSFHNISTEPNYIGGILCIDELDVSLHPDAQLRLLKLLKEQSKELKLQIIFTSHSLTVIQEMLRLKQKDSENHMVYYFRNNNRPFFREEDSYQSIKADLFSEIHYSMPKVKVYLEDEEAKFALEQIMNIYYEGKNESNLLNNCELIASQINCTTLLDLPNKDSYFKDTIIVLDGDARYKKKPSLKEFLTNDPKGYNSIQNYPRNVLFLPGDFSPEENVFRILYELLLNEDKHHDFWYSVEHNTSLGNYYPQMLLNELENMISQQKLDRENLKKWFQSHESFFDQSGIYKYYYKAVLENDNITTLAESFIKLVTNKLAALKSKGF